MGTVVDLASRRPEPEDPHIIFEIGPSNVYVMPVALIDNWISGKVTFDPSDQDLLRAIIRDWKERSLGL